MRYEPIYTEKTGCRDCYKCVRACPMKAIQVQQGSAVVVHDRCIFCGKCVDVCPVKAKKIRNDVSEAQELIKRKQAVYASLAPSYAAEFPGLEQELIDALHALGFAGVSETALGAEVVTQQANTVLKQSAQYPVVSSACPTVVEAICKYYPDLSETLTKIRSPLGVHSAMLREWYGEDIGVVFIGPCVSKKLEADRSEGFPDIALTFRELHDWFISSGIRLHDRSTLRPAAVMHTADPTAYWFQIDPDSDSRSSHAFVPYPAGETTNYALENGMISTLAGGDVRLQDKTAGVSGIHEVLDTLDGIISACNSSERDNLPVFFEMLSCRGGCINGPGCVSSTAHMIKKTISSRHVRSRLKQGQSNRNEAVKEIGRSICFEYQPFARYDEVFAAPAGYQIEKALKKLGKANDHDRLDCGGCGYSSCREFARAYLTGMAEPEMCVTKMRKQAQSKVDMLLRTLPMGVVIVDSGHLVVDCNSRFLKMFSTVAYDAGEKELEKVSGLKLNKFVKLQSYFAEIFSGARLVSHCTVNYEKQIISATFFSIDEGRLAGALFQDITAPTKHRDAVKKRAEAVIQKNLQSVQQIASLLGENAAETELMLSSLIDVFEHVQDKS